MKITRMVFLIMLMVYGILMNAQESGNDSIQVYFSKINELVEQKNKYPEEFLDLEFLLAKKAAAKGTEEIELLLDLYTAYVFSSWETAKKYNEEAFRLSEVIGYRKGILKANYNSAYLSFMKGNFEESMYLVREIDSVLDEETHPEIHADVITLQCDIYTEMGEFDMALEAGLNLLDSAEKRGNDYMLMMADAALSHYYLRIGNFSMARDYCLKGLDYIIKLKRTEYFYPKINEIARMTAKMEGPEKALEIYSFYFELEKKISPPGDYVQSIAYMILSDIYMSIGELDLAQLYLSKALKMNFANQFRFRTPRAFVQQAELYLKKKDTSKAILNYEKSVAAAELINAFDVVKSNSAILAGLYAKTGEFSKAYEYHTLHSAIRDSLFTNEREQKVSILEANRRIKEVTQQKQFLELKNKAHQSRYYTIEIYLVCLLFISGFATYEYLKLKGKNRFLYQRTKELAKIQVDMKEKLELFQNAKTNHLKNTDKEKISNTYQTLDDEVKDLIMVRLEKLENDEFFIEPNCNLHQLSIRLKTNPKYLSQVINQEKKSNFNNYINELRINYLLPKLIKDEEFRNSKLSYIAVSLGYNNLNTFNSAFKKRLGRLPSYFIDQLNSGSNEELLDEIEPRYQKIGFKLSEAIRSSNGFQGKGSTSL